MIWGAWRNWVAAISKLALTLKDNTTDNKRTEKCQRFAKLKELFSLPQSNPKQHI